MASLLLLSLPAAADSVNGPALPLNQKRTIIEGTQQVSPPALQFDGAGRPHVAWFEKQAEARRLRTLQLDADGKPLGSPVQVNPPNMQPDALHQAPGLAIGRNGTVFMTWSVPRNASDAAFATDLQLSVSYDGGTTFGPPATVNDDSAPISHSFEHIYVDPSETVYLTWLDNRSREKSGAAAIFAQSRDNGTTIGKNLTVDGMACPCCRPMATVSPEGTVWLAWRKTFEGNVRDIVLANSVDQGQRFSPPILVQQDGWAFPACPHRGPSIGFDRTGRLYVGWYTEGTDEQPRLWFAISDDRGKTFSTPISLHTSATSLPDQLRMAVHPDGAVVAVWEEVTGVRKRTVLRVSMDRGETFEPIQPLSDGAKAEYPTVAIHEDGSTAISWSEHEWPNNRLVVRQGTLDLKRIKKTAPQAP
jgi:hypothetical protein